MDGVGTRWITGVDGCGRDGDEWTVRGRSMGPGVDGV